jgi:hypothetical protein
MFKIVEFDSAKSTGTTHVTIRFNVVVYVRGKVDEGPIGTFPVETGAARGPDRMWYLDNGMLPTETV